MGNVVSPDDVTPTGPFRSMFILRPHPPRSSRAVPLETPKEIPNYILDFAYDTKRVSLLLRLLVVHIIEVYKARSL